MMQVSKSTTSMFLLSMNANLCNVFDSLTATLTQFKSNIASVGSLALKATAVQTLQHLLVLPASAVARRTENVSERSGKSELSGVLCLVRGLVLDLGCLCGQFLT